MGSELDRLGRHRPGKARTGGAATSLISAAVILELLPVIAIPVGLTHVRALEALAIAAWFGPGAGWVLVRRWKVVLVMVAARIAAAFYGFVALWFVISACLFGCSSRVDLLATIAIASWVAFALGQPIVSALALPLAVRPDD